MRDKDRLKILELVRFIMWLVYLFIIIYYFSELSTSIKVIVYVVFMGFVVFSLNYTIDWLKSIIKRSMSLDKSYLEIISKIEVPR
jgi:hypothetical protein